VKIIKEGNKIKLEESSEVVFAHKGKKVIVTKHSTIRQIERSKLSKNEIETLYKRSIDKIKSFKNAFGPYLFFSKSLKQGIVVDYREDYKDKDGGKHLIIITFLPRGKDKALKGTKKLMLERYVDLDENCSTHLSQEFLDYMSEISDSIEKDNEENFKVVVDESVFRFYQVDEKVWQEIDVDVFEFE